MLLPARMYRVQIIVSKEYYERLMQILRESRSIELIDVREMLKGYDDRIQPNVISPRLYRLASLSSKISNLINLLKLDQQPTAPAEVAASIPDDEIEKIETEVAALEKKVTSLTTEVDSLDELATFADEGLKKNFEAMLKIEDPQSPEGHHELREILDNILDQLAGGELAEAERLAEDLKAAAVTEALRQSLLEEVATALSQGRNEKVAAIIDRTLDLKLRTDLKAKRMQFAPESRVQKAKERAANLRGDLAGLADEYGLRLLIWSEIVTAERMLEEAKGFCGKTEHTFVVEGYVPGSDLKPLKAEIEKLCGDLCLIYSWRAHQAPTKLQNPPLTGIFQSLTVGFGVPQSTEVDPTVLWLVTYPIFFGLMFGDLAHGLLVVVVSALLYVAKTKGLRVDDSAYVGMGGIFNMVIQGSPLLMLSGVSATVVGYFYGTVFGSENWFALVTGLHKPPWFAPFQEPIKLLGISIKLGIIHIISGLVLDSTNKILHKEYHELIAGPVAWLWFYIGFGYLIVSQGFNVINFALQNLTQTFLVVGLPSVAMAGLKLWVEGGMGLVHWFEAMVASLSHTISYIRILAMKMIHDVFSLIILQMFGAVTAAVAGIVGLILGGIVFSFFTLLLILALETAFVFMQSLRLHWVEWFLKFYSGSGVAFKPFGLARNFTSVKIA